MTFHHYSYNGRRLISQDAGLPLPAMPEDVDHISFGLDFKIFWLTIFKVFTNADNENKGETVKK